MSTQKAIAALQALDTMHFKSLETGHMPQHRYVIVSNLTGNIRSAINRAVELEQELIDLQRKTTRALASMQRIVDQTNAQNDANIDLELEASRQQIEALELLLFYETQCVIEKKCLDPKKIKLFNQLHGHLFTAPQHYVDWWHEHQLIEQLHQLQVPIDKQQHFDNLKYFKLKAA